MDSQQESATRQPEEQPDASAGAPSANDQLAIGEAERERLLWATKKQVKQIMEEAVTRKFVHEDSSSLISLCVAIDACLAHGLKRRVLGLFRTSSSMALLHKIAKDYPLGKEILDLVQQEEARLRDQQQRQAKRFSSSSSGATASYRQADSSSSASRSLKWPLRSQTAQQDNNQAALVHKRNLWLKLALIENKLVQVFEYLAENAGKYYKQDALMANYVIARVLSSLLVGPSALKYKRCHINELIYSDPTAHELISRHKLANPIACLCEQQPTHASDSLPTSVFDPEVAQKTASRCSETDAPCCNNRSSNLDNQHDETTVAAASHTKTPGRRSASPRDCDQAPRKSDLQAAKRRPLSLKGSINGGILITNCHHYSCQEISEHQQTRGYSLRSASHSTPTSATVQPTNMSSPFPVAADSSSSKCAKAGTCLRQQDDQQQQMHHSLDGPVWSPRILHDILHQNSRSNLLFAKNNVLLETQNHQTIAGYLSLHQVGFSDLVLKWIPNQMINGTQCHSVPVDSENSQLSNDSQCNNDSGSPTPTGNCEMTTLKDQPTNAVESSYLELVVSVPMSKIVLLHCQFNRLDDSFQFDDSAGVKKTSGSYMEAAIGDQPNQPGSCNNTEEILILVETDGVQMAPFRFPKGGLRSFLSCLQTGLGPDRYLDPAIQFDDCSAYPRSPACCNNDTSNNTESKDNNSSLDSPRCSPVPRSRFDSLIRRLPSLKRRDTSCINAANNLNSEIGQESAPVDTGLVPTMLPKVNYVYRIVPSSIQQLHEPSLGDDVSLLSFDAQQATKTNSETRSRSESVSQRFRWSLSRMARFSSMYSNSSNQSTTTNSGQIVDATNDNRRQQTLDSVSLHEQADSLDSSACDKTANGTQLGSASGKSRSAMEMSKSLRDFTKVEAKLSELKASTSDEVLQTFRTQSIQTLCESMRKQITARAFYGWLSYCRKAKIVRTYLSHMIKPDAATYLRLQTSGRFACGTCSTSTSYSASSDDDDDVDDANLDSCDETYNRMRAILAKLRSLGTRESASSAGQCLSQDQWDWLMANKKEFGDEHLLAKLVGWLVYLNGIESNELRRRVWPYLLRYYKFTVNSNGNEANRRRNKVSRKVYSACQRDWIQVERVVMQRDEEILSANIARAKQLIGAPSDDVADCLEQMSTGGQSIASTSAASVDNHANGQQQQEQQDSLASPSTLDEAKLDSAVVQAGASSEPAVKCCATNNNNNSNDAGDDQVGDVNNMATTSTKARPTTSRRHRLDSTGSLDSNASLTDKFGNNVHRIDKDVQRCDRNYHYFKDSDNLNKLRRIMCTYVWQHLEVGYVQGMCDLAAPFLVIYQDDELMAFNCFSKLMERMVANFPHGTAMDKHFESLRYLIQVLDPKLFEVLQRNGDYSYFYFCYRWLLLDFKRELAYDDVFLVWETIWSARFVVTDHFVVFVALAMVRYYRNIIIENNMDFTDTIKFFNEMAEKHDAKKITALARDSIIELHSLMKTWS